MTAVLEKAMLIYPKLFENYLDVNVMIRLAGFAAAALLFSFVVCLIVLPLGFWIFGPLLVKLWNFVVTESLYEYIYIRYLSDNTKEPPKFFKLWFQKLGKKIHTRLLYLNAKPSVIYRWDGVDDMDRVREHRKIVNRRWIKRLSILLNITLFLSVVSFFVTTVIYDFNLFQTQYTSIKAAEETPLKVDSLGELTDDKQMNVFYCLNEGVTAGNVRSLPSFDDSSVIEQVKEEAKLLYLNEKLADPVDESIVWIKIKTPTGAKGWVSDRIFSEMQE